MSTVGGDDHGVIGDRSGNHRAAAGATEVAAHCCRVIRTWNRNRSNRAAAGVTAVARRNGRRTRAWNWDRCDRTSSVTRGGCGRCRSGGRGMTRSDNESHQARTVRRSRHIWGTRWRSTAAGNPSARWRRGRFTAWGRGSDTHTHLKPCRQVFAHFVRAHNIGIPGIEVLDGDFVGQSDQKACIGSIGDSLLASVEDWDARNESSFQGKSKEEIVYSRPD